MWETKTGVLQLYNFFVLPVVHFTYIPYNVRISNENYTSPNQCVSMKFPLKILFISILSEWVFVANFLGITYADLFHPFYVIYVSFRPLMKVCRNLYGHDLKMFPFHMIQFDSWKAQYASTLHIKILIEKKKTWKHVKYTTRTSNLQKGS